MIEIVIHQQHFILHPSGGIYWKETQTWLLADVHLGKVAHFRKHGIAVPRKIEGIFYQKIDRLLKKFPSKRVIFLGDLFHSYQNNEWYLFEAWVNKQKAKLILIQGNHDIIPVKEFKILGLTVVDSFEEDEFYFTHYPIEKEPYFVFCGHLHPGAKLMGIGHQQLKLPCFYQTPKKLILPAFGSFTGLHLVSPTTEDQVYAITENAVLEIEKKN
jgi:DNA ligase-associated metallophosphoesterase